MGNGLMIVQHAAAFTIWCAGRWRCWRSTFSQNASLVVAHRLGIAAPDTYDLSAACAGLCFALANPSDSIRTGRPNESFRQGARQ